MRFLNGFIFVKLLMMVVGFFALSPRVEAVPRLNDYYMNVFSVREGLSQSTVFSVYQDSEGFIWLGTRGGGLNRFDGYHFDVFMHSSNDPQSLSNNEVISIYEDINKQLWVGTRYGELNRFDRDRKQFFRYKLDLSDVVAVNCFYEDEKGMFWLGTDRGLYLFNQSSDSFSVYESINPDLILPITGIIGHEEDEMILATRIGMYKLNTRKKSITKLANIVAEPLMGGYFNVPVMKDHKSNIWYGTPGGLYVFSDAQLTISVENPYKIKELSNKHIRTLGQDRSGFVWIGYTEGLIRLHPETGEYLSFKAGTNQPGSLPHPSVYSFFEDKSNNIWVGSWGGGITMLSSIPRKFRHYQYTPYGNSISDNIVSAFAETGEGVWIGTEGGGLNLYDPASEKFSHYGDLGQKPLTSKHIKCLFADRHQRLWVGTWGGGLCYLNPASGTYRHYLDDARVYTISEHPTGTIWIGTINGLYRLNMETDELSEYHRGVRSAGLRDFFITSIFTDSRGNTWVGTREGGLHLYNRLKDEFISYGSQSGNATGIIDNYIICITEDQSGLLWIGTNSGVFRFDILTGDFDDMTSIMNLPNKVINGIVADPYGHLWVSTNKGITRHHISNGSSKHFDMRDGLQSNEFNRGAFFQSSTNHIFFGGINGYNSFHPGEMRENTLPPDVIITNFKLFNKTVNPGDDDHILKEAITITPRITLNYKQSIFSFDFVALNYVGTEKNRYKYKLEGYNHEWVDIGHDRSVSFMNLRDGNYIFRVIASNNDDVWNLEGASVHLTILPPPWRTGWAYLMYLMTISLMMFFLYRLMSARLQRRSDMLNEKLEKERTEAMNQVKLRFFTNITHEFKTPLTLMAAPLEGLLSADTARDKKEYFYSLIKTNIQRLRYLVEELMDFRKLEQDFLKPRVRKDILDDFLRGVFDNFKELADSKGIEFVIDCESLKDDEYWFDSEILEKILFNVLSNAFKFTPQGGRIIIHAHVVKDLALIRVQDTGLGILEEELPYVFEQFYTSKVPGKSYLSGSGIGLSFAKRLIEMHHGTIDVASEPNVRTEFTITFPINRSAYSAEEIMLTTREANFAEKQGYSHFEPQVPEQEHDDEDADNQRIMLVVEDNEEIAHYLISQFSDNFKVVHACNGRDGYARARDLLPDIIISDIMMDEMTGLELCSKIKSDILTTHIPFILLSVLSSGENKLEGLEMGADAYVEKPFEFKFLNTVVTNLLNQRAAMKEKYLLENLMLAGNSQDHVESKFLKKVEEIVINYLSDPEFSIVVLSDKLNVSRSQLFRKFKSITGKSPSDFIRILRLKKAAEIMLHDDIGVNEVAYAVGFTTPSHFIASFKKYFGKTPREYAQTKRLGRR